MRKRIIAAVTAVAFAVTTLAVAPHTSTAQPGADNPGQGQLPGQERTSKIDEDVYKAIAADPDVELIVLVAGDTKPAQAARARAKAEQLGGRHVRGAAIVMKAERANLRALENDPDIVAVSVNWDLEPTMASEAGYVGASTPTTGMWAQGYTGTGMLTAIVDTGFDFTHPAMSGQARAEFCFLSQSPSDCPGGVDGVTGVGVSQEPPGQSHGTGTGSIIASTNATERGIAHGGKLIASRVMDDDGDISLVGLWATLDWIDDNTDSQGRWTTTNEPVGAVSASLNGGFISEHSPTCASAAVQPSIDALRAKGIPFVVAAGNESMKNAIRFPACLPNVISAGRSSGSTTNVSAESNSSNFLDVHAPGTEVAARPAALGGGFTSAFGGTSSSAPQVAAALTLLRQAAPSSTIQQREEVIRTTGPIVSDQRTNGQSQIRRLDIPAAKAKLVTEYASTASGKYISNAPGVYTFDTGAYGGMICANCTRSLNIAALTGRGSQRVKAVWANVFTYSGASTGWAVLYGGPNITAPVATNVGIVAGETKSNAALIPVNEQGVVYIYSPWAHHFRIDVIGFMGANASDFHTVNGTRVVSNTGVTGGVEFQSNVIPGGTFAGFTFPANTNAVVASVNVVANPGGFQYIKTYPNAGAPPTAYNAVMAPRSEPAQKLTVLKLGADGRFRYKSWTNTVVSIDVVGYTTGNNAMVAMNPTQVASSLSVTGPCFTPAGVPSSCSALGNNHQIDIGFGGAAGIPANARGVFANFPSWNGYPGTSLGYWRIWQQGSGSANPTLFFNPEPPGSGAEWTNAPIAVGLNPANGRVSLLNATATQEFMADAYAYFPA